MQSGYSVTTSKICLRDGQRVRHSVPPPQSLTLGMAQQHQWRRNRRRTRLQVHHELRDRVWCAWRQPNAARMRRACLLASDDEADGVNRHGVGRLAPYPGPCAQNILLEPNRLCPINGEQSSPSCSATPSDHDMTRLSLLPGAWSVASDLYTLVKMSVASARSLDSRSATGQRPSLRMRLPPALALDRSLHLTPPTRSPRCPISLPPSSVCAGRSSRLKNVLWVGVARLGRHQLPPLAGPSSTTLGPMVACRLVSRRCPSPRLTAILSYLSSHTVAWAGTHCVL